MAGVYLVRRIAVSFENEVIRVVYASLRRGNLIIKKTLVLRDEEFDEFLKKEKARHFTIVCDFKSFYQDILLLPPVKEKFLKNIVEAEIRKKSPEFRDCSFFHVILGERMHEGRKMHETLVFAVNNHDLFQIIDRFDRYGKKISAIYPAAFTIAQLVSFSYGIVDEPVLCVAESESGKILLLMKEGKLYFMRDAQSFESGIHDIDVQSINMTVNYCRQTLRLTPSQVILIGTACSKYEPTMDLLLPVLCMEPPSDIIASRETITDFIIPISAMLNIEGMKDGNLLPESYRRLQRQKTILAYYTTFFLLLSIIGLGYIKIKHAEIAEIKKEIGLLRSEIRGMESIRIGYENKKKELDKVMPLINFMNAMNSSANLQKVLVSLSSIKELRDKDINIVSIDINPEGTVVRIKLKGNVTAADFTAMQQAYQNLVKAMKKAEGIEIVSDKIDIKDKSFQIELKIK
jgi:hypothetical protein